MNGGEPKFLDGKNYNNLEDFINEVLKSHREIFQSTKILYAKR